MYTVGEHDFAEGIPATIIVILKVTQTHTPSLETVASPELLGELLSAPVSLCIIVKEFVVYHLAEDQGVCDLTFDLEVWVHDLKGRVVVPYEVVAYDLICCR